MQRPYLWLAAPLVLAAAAISPAQAEVLVGVADVFSGPAGYGFNTFRAVELAADQINRKGGVLGQSVRIITADDACDGDQAMAAAHKMVADGVIFVIGHSCSSAAISASKVYQEAGILYMTASATHPKLTEEGGPNVFRLRGRADQVGTLIADYLAKRWNGKHIAIVHDGGLFGRSTAEYVKRELNQRGSNETIYEEISPGQLVYSELVTKLQAAGIDVVFFGGYTVDAGLFIRQARERGAEFVLGGK